MKRQEGEETLHTKVNKMAVKQDDRVRQDGEFVSIFVMPNVEFAEIIQIFWKPNLEFLRFGNSLTYLTTYNSPCCETVNPIFVILKIQELHLPIFGLPNREFSISECKFNIWQAKS